MSRYTHPKTIRLTEEAQRDLEIWLSRHLPQFVITDVDDGDMLVYDEGLGYWVNGPASGLRTNMMLLMGG